MQIKIAARRNSNIALSTVQISELDFNPKPAQVLNFHHTDRGSQGDAVLDPLVHPRHTPLLPLAAAVVDRGGAAMPRSQLHETVQKIKTCFTWLLITLEKRRASHCKFTVLRANKLST